jgi:hypothetical protein
MEVFDGAVNKIGVEKLDSLIDGNSVTETLKIIRENIFSV